VTQAQEGQSQYDLRAFDPAGFLNELIEKVKGAVITEAKALNLESDNFGKFVEHLPVSVNDQTLITFDVENSAKLLAINVGICRI